MRLTQIVVPSVAWKDDPFQRGTDGDDGCRETSVWRLSIPVKLTNHLLFISGKRRTWPQNLKVIDRSPTGPKEKPVAKLELVAEFVPDDVGVLLKSGEDVFGQATGHGVGKDPMKFQPQHVTTAPSFSSPANDGRRRVVESRYPDVVRCFRTDSRGIIRWLFGGFVGRLCNYSKWEAVSVLQMKNKTKQT